MLRAYNDLRKATVSNTVLIFSLTMLLAACASPLHQVPVYTATVTEVSNGVRKDYSYAGKGPKPVVPRARIAFRDLNTGKIHKIMANGFWEKGDVLYYTIASDGSILPKKKRT